MAHNEKVFLPIWLKYYSQFFDPEDIYVVDHDSNDGSIEDLSKKYKFNVVKVHSGTVYDNQFMVDTVTTNQHELLKKYKIVVYSDADEAIIVDPLVHKDLGEYLKSFKGDYATCNSRSVIHQISEPPIDLNQKVLAQRAVWYREMYYDKTLISRVPLVWSKGLHTLLDENGSMYVPKQTEGLFLLHLARLDYKLREKLNSITRKEKWGGQDGEAFQRRIKGNFFKKWFYFEPTILANENNQELFIEFIPERFKQIV